MKGILVRSHIGWKKERNIVYKGVETSPSQTFLKHWREARKGSPKRTISASGGLGLLQIVSEPDIGWCASEDVGPPRGLDCEIPYRLERGQYLLAVGLGCHNLDFF